MVLSSVLTGRVSRSSKSSINMRKAFIILNHLLTKTQESELRSEFEVERIIEMPEVFKEIWGGISAQNDLFNSGVRDIIEWLKIDSQPSDVVVVQGEWGASFLIVDFCFCNKLIPLYASSERLYEQKDLKDGRVKRTHIFKHVRFKRYMRFNEIVWGHNG